MIFPKHLNFNLVSRLLRVFRVSLVPKSTHLYSDRFFRKSVIERTKNGTFAFSQACNVSNPQR